jgi:Tetracyclin repressor-like, C-terminal domain
VLLERAIKQQEIRANINIEVAVDLLYGPLFFRLLIGHAPLDEKFMDQVLDEFLQGMSV